MIILIQVAEAEGDFSRFSGFDFDAVAMTSLGDMRVAICIKIDEFCIKIDVFCSNNDDFDAGCCGGSGRRPPGSPAGQFSMEESCFRIEES